MQISFAESEVGGAGPQWRAAGWTASLAAAEMTDFSDLMTQVAFDIRGRIDGPSAGALMTIGVLAAARGHAIRPDATMTGTINPDGFIGPVGGIVHKIEGAAQAGKKLLVIPPGIAVQEHLDTGVPSNLKWVGERQGVQVVPARDIYAAYRLLTGADLPRPPEPTEELPPYRLGPIYGISAHWAGRRREKDLWGLPDSQLTPEIAALIEKSKAILEHASELHEEGAPAAALQGYLDGAGAQYEAIALVRCLVAFQNGGMSGVVDLLRSDAWLQKEEEAAAAALKGYEILTVEQAAVQLQGLDAFFLGISRRAVAAKLLETLPDSSEAARYAAACRVSVYQSLAKASFQLASDYAEWAQEPRGTLVADDAPLAQLADFYGRAGNANEAVFDSLIVDPQAAARNIPAQQMKLTLMQRDRDYAALAPASECRNEAIRRYFPQGSERTYARLAAGIYSYWRAAALVAKHYSLGAKLDQQLEISGLEREQTFYEWLEASDRATYRNVAHVYSLGIDPISCQYQYDIAHVIRGRELPSRLEALTMFFRANIESRIVVHIARQEKP